MENNEHKPFNPIARAREQANLASKHAVHTQNEYAEKKEDIDIFGNTDPLSAQQIFEDSNPVETKPEAPTTTENATQEAELKTYTVSNNGVEESEMVMTNDNNQNGKVVEEKPNKKEKKEKRVRIINSTDAVITPEDIKESRKYAWLAYILFFIPLFINRNNEYVRHNVNEGLEIFIFDVLAAVLLILNAVIDSANMIVSFILMLGSIIGIVLLILTTITKIYMIIITLMGKRANTPWLWNFRIIK